MKAAGARPYRRSGVYGLQRRLQAGGLEALNGELSPLAREAEEWVARVAQDLGGDAALSEQQRTLLRAAAGTRLLLAYADQWIAEAPHLRILDKRHRKLTQLVRDRTTLSAHLVGVLKDLGLERRARPLPTLAEHLAQKEKQ